MLFITDAMVDAAIGAEDVQAVLTEAFRSFARGDAAMQERVRTSARGVKLSMMGGLIPGQEVAGAKVYTTIDGAFSFVIVLFSTVTGAPLATLEANAITRLRTPATSVIAARHLARPDSHTLAVFGAGVQGRAHAAQFAGAYPLREILLCVRQARPETAAEIAAATGVPTRFAGAEEAIAAADIVVTASRSKTPLFAGDAIRSGTFIAAVGSSLPNTRELDDRALQRASVIAVEYREQSRKEAGDLVQAAPGVAPPEKIVELGDLIAGLVPGRTADDKITVYKSVGVGLEDIAVAGLAWRRIAGG